MDKPEQIVMAVIYTALVLFIIGFSVTYDLHMNGWYLCLLGWTTLSMWSFPAIRAYRPERRMWDPRTWSTREIGVNSVLLAGVVLFGLLWFASVSHGSGAGSPPIAFQREG